MIGIIGAMRAEVDALIEKLEGCRVTQISGIPFYTGKLEGKEIVIAPCGVGKVFAATCAQTMILKFAPEFILHTGVAGSLSKSLSVGDIALASALVQHDMDTSPLGDPKGLISGINIVEIPTDDNLTKSVATIADRLSLTHKSGIVATGDRFVATPEGKNEIAKEFGAIACEMEGGAIAQVCFINQIPLCVIRAISDSLDGNGSMEYPVFLSLAAERAVKLIVTFLKSL